MVGHGKWEVHLIPLFTVSALKKVTVESVGEHYKKRRVMYHGDLQVYFTFIAAVGDFVHVELLPSLCATWHKEQYTSSGYAQTT